MTDATITGIVCPPLKCLKPLSTIKRATKDSASSVNLISAPSISDSVSTSVHQQTPATAKAKPVPRVTFPSMTKPDSNTQKQKELFISRSKSLDKLHFKAKALKCNLYCLAFSYEAFIFAS
ncbi:hypothetical protein CDAR_538881 [Caerostris darwini]|uniref:Uncharacterized protein n=1 Tax=Caerostris darwini TaxID=1538125 RepID=A0AAV4T446_9ARAC|nr:hypothetical protein CDAR_538881 [Caerostris darwini]